jgi:hypothetical protein
MHHVASILESRSMPSLIVRRSVLEECLEACVDCAADCRGCADACLDEPAVQMLARCIRLDLACADVCEAAARALSAVDSPELIHSLIETCRLFCGVCADECERHAKSHEHCRICAEACRECERRCNELLGAQTWS